MNFVNRAEEIELLSDSSWKLAILYGRRRVGKSALITNWHQKHKSKNNRPTLYYSQAIEGAEALQISQLTQDWEGLLPEGANPRNWVEFLALLSTIQKDCLIAIDEFPYLVKSQASLPSMLQKWLDHNKPPGLRLVLLGSSQTMMSNIFLDYDSPLFHRAELVLHVKPMTYSAFFESLNLKNTKETFELFSLVGGIPQYWKILRTGKGTLENADILYFRDSARLENEPAQLLRDEDVGGTQAKSIMESIGRGARKPSEIASKIGITQTALSKPLQIMLKASMIRRSLPFGKSLRSSKRTLYSFSDPSIQFWYTCYSPHRTRWHIYSNEKKLEIIHQHSSKILEQSYRALFPDAKEYWESDLEFDCVRYADESSKNLIISEIKHRNIPQNERMQIMAKLEFNFTRSRLATKYKLAKTEVLDTEDVLEQIGQSR